jgi:hypothetical protein
LKPHQVVLELVPLHLQEQIDLVQGGDGQQFLDMPQFAYK